MDRFTLMETFAAVVATGSVTRASARLGVSGAMVSKRLQTLEEELGVRLLNRNTHGHEITENGAEYYDRCVRLLADVRHLEESMHQRRRAARGELCVMSTRTFSEMTLAPVIADFCARYPGISLRMILMDRTLAPRGTDLISGGFDVAIRSLSSTDSSLIARPLIEMAQGLVASPSYLERRGTPRTPNELADHNCLAPDATTNLNLWELWGGKGLLTVRVSGVPRTNGSLIVREAALKGLGIAKLRLDLVRAYLSAGTLQLVMPDYPPPPKRFFAIYLRNKHQPQRVTLFIEFLRRRLRVHKNDST